ncbi:MAG: YecH family protein [Acidobacteriota bacterium]
MLQELGEPCPEARLREEAVRRFGPDARFHTCSIDDLTLNDLLEFLAALRKLDWSSAGVSIVRERVCRDV